MRQPAMGTNPIWYQIAEECAKRHPRPLRHDERIAFVEGVVAAFELAEEHELLVDLSADIDLLEKDFENYPSPPADVPLEGLEFIEPPC